MNCSPEIREKSISHRGVTFIIYFNTKITEFEHFNSAVNIKLFGLDSNRSLRRHITKAGQCITIQFSILIH